jgi:hypothetical protein
MHKKLKLYIFKRLFVEKLCEVNLKGHQATNYSCNREASETDRSRDGL